MIEIMELTANVHLEDGAYWADVPELPGCFASGDTLDELLASLNEGIRLYREDSKLSSQSFQVKTAVLCDAVFA